ncbi:MAG: ribosome silencing factor [Burkholderiaceae bacterium]|nr:ribosome silencing factor [Burkholderiaceae bacterium]MDO9089590.1 ribosome silencing factor [Burkholderiaceae bacterium]
MTTETRPDSVAKKDVQKLQRAIVDGLEDVKGQDIEVFNTEHLSALFERVIIVSGTSNRQTKALASSVRDAVREAGFPKPRIEGEENGEWIIVDCGAAVAHIMQPTIRQYYHLEELWGDKPVRLKLGAPQPAARAPAKKAARQPKDGAQAARMEKAASDAAKKSNVRGKRAAPAKGAVAAAGKSTARPASRAATQSPARSAGKPVAKPAAQAKPRTSVRSATKAAGSTASKKSAARR